MVALVAAVSMGWFSSFLHQGSYRAAAATAEGGSHEDAAADDDNNNEEMELHDRYDDEIGDRTTPGHRSSNNNSGVLEAVAMSLQTQERTRQRTCSSGDSGSSSYSKPGSEKERKPLSPTTHRNEIRRESQRTWSTNYCSGGAVLNEKRGSPTVVHKDPISSCPRGDSNTKPNQLETDPLRKTILVNDAVGRMSGERSDEMIGCPSPVYKIDDLYLLSRKSQVLRQQQQQQNRKELVTVEIPVAAARWRCEDLPYEEDDEKTNQEQEDSQKRSSTQRYKSSPLEEETNGQNEFRKQYAEPTSTSATSELIDDNNGKGDKTCFDPSMERDQDDRIYGKIDSSTVTASVTAAAKDSDMDNIQHEDSNSGQSKKSLPASHSEKTSPKLKPATGGSSPDAATSACYTTGQSRSGAGKSEVSEALAKESRSATNCKNQNDDDKTVGNRDGLVSVTPTNPSSNSRSDFELDLSCRTSMVDDHIDAEEYATSLLDATAVGEEIVAPIALNDLRQRFGSTDDTHDEMAAELLLNALDQHATDEHDDGTKDASNHDDDEDYNDDDDDHGHPAHDVDTPQVSDARAVARLWELQLTPRHQYTGTEYDDAFILESLPPPRPPPGGTGWKSVQVVARPENSCAAALAAAKLATSMAERGESCWDDPTPASLNEADDLKSATGMTPRRWSAGYKSFHASASWEDSQQEHLAGVDGWATPRSTPLHGTRGGTGARFGGGYASGGKALTAAAVATATTKSKSTTVASTWDDPVTLDMVVQGRFKSSGMTPRDGLNGEILGFKSIPLNAAVGTKSLMPSGERETPSWEEEADKGMIVCNESITAAAKLNLKERTTAYSAVVTDSSEVGSDGAKTPRTLNSMEDDEGKKLPEKRKRDSPRFPTRARREEANRKKVKWDRQRCGGCLGCSELADCGKCIMCKSKGEQACIFRPCKLQPEEDRRRNYLYRKDFLKHGDRIEVGTRVYAKWHENEVSFLEFSSSYASSARS